MKYKLLGNIHDLCPIRCSGWQIKKTIVLQLMKIKKELIWGN